MSNGNNNGHQRNGTGNGLVHSPPRTENGVNGNGHKPDAASIDGHELLWDGLSPAVTEKLGQPLDPALVSTRDGRGGKDFHYLKGHVVFEQANRIFGRGGWGYDTVGDVTLRDIENVDTETGEVKRGQAYAAKVMVIVPGAPSRTDVGFHAVVEKTVEGHETAYKGAVTDGVKRALRSFGDQFGNGFYGDQSPPIAQRRSEQGRTKQNGAHPAPQVDAPSNTPQDGEEARLKAMRSSLIELGAAQGFDKSQVEVAVRRETGRDLVQLSAEELDRLVERATLKLARIREERAA